MPVLPHLPRFSLSSSTYSRRSLRVAGQCRSLSLLPSSSSSSVPFFVPHFGSASKNGVYPTPGGKGKDKELFGDGRGFDPEEEVDDREWDMRVGKFAHARSISAYVSFLARAMIHLQETLPHFFNAEMTAATMLPPDIYSQNMVLKLPAPLPLKVCTVTVSRPTFEGETELHELIILLDILIVWLFHGIFSYSQWHARSRLHRAP